MATWGDFAGDFPFALTSNRWCALYVPYQDRHLVKALGCKWSNQRQQWLCTTRQYRQKRFARYRTKQFATTEVHIGFGEIAHAKQLGCRWMPAPDKRWVYDLPDDEVEPWILDRLTPPEMTYVRVPYNERQAAKDAGACFDGKTKLWRLPARDMVSHPELARYVVEAPHVATPDAAGAAPQSNDLAAATEAAGSA